ncbi:MAG TPA: MTH938/NDUFAF3 family protein [Burkholderiales bacterium]|nr:MTH938/NDUFAF3 family protein [Burkholderiales bacterium]
MSGGKPPIAHFPRPAPIEAYGQGGFRFADMSHRGSLLCLPSGIWAWDVMRAIDISEETLAAVFENAKAIDTLIIGTGKDVWLPPSALREKLRAQRIVIDPMQTGPAITTYNIMLGEGRRVAAALIAV